MNERANGLLIDIFCNLFLAHRMRSLRLLTVLIRDYYGLLLKESFWVMIMWQFYLNKQNYIQAEIRDLYDVDIT